MTLPHLKVRKHLPRNKLNSDLLQNIRSKVWLPDRKEQQQKKAQQAKWDEIWGDVTRASHSNPIWKAQQDSISVGEAEIQTHVFDLPFGARVEAGLNGKFIVDYELLAARIPGCFGVICEAAKSDFRGFMSAANDGYPRHLILQSAHSRELDISRSPHLQNWDAIWGRYGINRWGHPVHLFAARQMVRHMCAETELPDLWVDGVEQLNDSDDENELMVCIELESRPGQPAIEPSEFASYLPQLKDITGFEWLGIDYTTSEQGEISFHASTAPPAEITLKQYNPHFQHTLNPADFIDGWCEPEE